MELEPGRTLSHYRLIEKIGQGGMGVVWTATDTQLDRTVALKFLPEKFVGDSERLQRFQREARLLASLSHGNIATLHGIEYLDATPFLVMEFVDGEHISDHLASRPMAPERALELARQVASALVAAHDKSIIHRDLKPANVVLTADGNAKLLDFGLAKYFQPETALPASDEETADHTPTVAGSIVGTPGYMSPEQARGENVDQQTDIWALGCLLYEMLTGRRAFPGSSTADTLVAILEREPDWSALPGVPSAVRSLLERCLAKELAERYSDAKDVLNDLEEILLPPPARPRRTLAWVAGVVGVSAIVGAILWTGQRDAPAELQLPALEQLTFEQGVERFPAWSPDGKRIAYCREQGGIRKIQVHDLSAGSTQQVTGGPADDIQPAWHPDGRSLLFVRAREPGQKLQPGDVFGQYFAGDLWKVDLATGSETRLAENAFNPSYSPDGRRIAVDASWVAARRIWLLDEHGRNPVQLTVGASEGMDHVRPRWSPNGRFVLLQAVQRTTFDVYIAEVDTGKMWPLTDDYFPDYHPVFSPDGKYAYFSSYRSGGTNVWRVPLDGNGRAAGRPQQVTAGAGQDVDLSMSPDGRLAFAILSQNADIWSLPVDPAGRPTGEPTEVLATTREDSRGAWSPDGRLLAFNSDRTGEMNIWLHDPANGSSQQLTRGPGGDYQPTWSPDGSTLVFFSSRQGNADIWTVAVESGEMSRLTDDEAYDVNPFFSPDGSQIAFHSDRGGRLEVWLMNADGSSQAALTDDGVMGHFLRWSDDGRFVYFKCPCGGEGRVMRAPVDGGPPEDLPTVVGGSHMSFSLDRLRILDVAGHQTLWVSPLDGGEPEVVFRFDDPGVRIDYPTWSPDGKTVLFDRFRPAGCDIWTTRVDD